MCFASQKVPRPFKSNYLLYLPHSQNKVIWQQCQVTSSSQLEIHVYVRILKIDNPNKFYQIKLKQLQELNTFMYISLQINGGRCLGSDETIWGRRALVTELCQSIRVFITHLCLKYEL